MKCCIRIAINAPINLFIYRLYRVEKIRERKFLIIPRAFAGGKKGSKVGERWPFPAIDPTVERLILIRTYPDRETFLIDFPDTIINDK